MFGTRFAIAGALLTLGGAALCGDASASGDRPKTAAADPWESVKFAVARESTASIVAFSRSLQWWTRPQSGEMGSDQGEFVTFKGDVTGAATLPVGPVVHIRGDLASSLHVPDHAEVVVGGSIVKGGRIEADGIVSVHVQGNVDGTVACRGMAAVWVGGDLRGEVLTGTPSMHLQVAGDLVGSVRPMAEPALLYIGVQGHAASTILASIDRQRYTWLQIAVVASDLGQGIHPLRSGPNGFVAVAGATLGK